MPSGRSFAISLRAVGKATGAIKPDLRHRPVVPNLHPLCHADTRAASAARDCRVSNRPCRLPCAAARSRQDATDCAGSSERSNDPQNRSHKLAPAPPRFRCRSGNLFPFHAVRGTTEQPHDQRADFQHKREIQGKRPEQRCGGSRALVGLGRCLASKHTLKLFLQLPDLRVRGARRSGGSQSHRGLQSVRHGRNLPWRGRLDARQCRSGGTKAVEALWRPAPSQGVGNAQDPARAGCGSDQSACAKAGDRSIPEDIAQEAPPDRRGNDAKCDLKQYAPNGPATQLARNEARKKAKAEPGYDGHCPPP